MLVEVAGVAVYYDERGSRRRAPRGRGRAAGSSDPVLVAAAPRVVLVGGAAAGCWCLRPWWWLRAWWWGWWLVVAGWSWLLCVSPAAASTCYA